MKQRRRRRRMDFPIAGSRPIHQRKQKSREKKDTPAKKLRDGR
jgi:hypothetical protein